MAQISLARPGDLPHLLSLLERSKLPPDGITEHMGTTLLAREGSRVVGSAAIEVYGRSGLLRSVAVDVTLRGLGLGHELTEAAIALARDRGITTLYLLTETAAGFFPRFGFRRVERADVDPAVQRSVEFTTACPANALVMALELPPADRS